MQSTTPESTGQENGEEGGGVDPGFLAKVQAKRAVYQAQTQSDKRKREETRAGLGRNNMEDYIAEHQQFIAEQETRNPPPAPEE
ncbi:hypothetical protein TrCOL_g13543 [Triparma columacea]|uniref:Uncharacterized protein n=1 Tax=Triparma columacea TaxID=722753 RepID=A0A9W7GH19_9STRA|nr:hypothetical protein TrCOL_g13543 [Triparma columacea]